MRIIRRNLRIRMSFKNKLIINRMSKKGKYKGIKDYSMSKII